MKVKVEYIFSKSNTIGSKVIRFGSQFLAPNVRPVPSHVALLINGKWVYEATVIKGVRVIGFTEWSKKNILTHRIDINDIRSHSRIKHIVRTTANKKYDYLGVLYLGIAVLKKWIFRIRIPRKNAWHSPKRYFCSELAGRVLMQKFDMVSPAEIVAILNNTHLPHID